MKKTILTLIGLVAVIAVKAQDFNKYLATAQSAYSSGKLEDSRFAMEQMLQELDIITGKEILKILPPKLDTLTSVASKDDVSGSSSFAGVVTQRTYGQGDKSATVELITNSPVVASLNAVLALPSFLNRANADQKSIKVGSYKGILTRDNEVNKAYQIQVPIGTSLFTLKSQNTSEEEMMKFANAVPLDQIIKKLQ